MRTQSLADQSYLTYWPKNVSSSAISHSNTVQNYQVQKATWWCLIIRNYLRSTTNWPKHTHTHLFMYHSPLPISWMTTHRKAIQQRHLTTEYQHRTVTIITGQITNCHLQKCFFISTCTMSYENDRQHNL